MKQISNWVFGSFFRTIGRLLVFVVLGFIIARFVDFDNIKNNFRLTDLLGIETIKASENFANYSVWYQSNGAQISLQQGGFARINNSSTTNTEFAPWFYYSSNQGTINAKYDYLEIQVSKYLYINSAQTSTSDSYTPSQTCTVSSRYHELGPVDPYETDYEYEVTGFSCPAQTTSTENYTDIINVSVQGRVVYGNGGWSICYFKNCTDTNCLMHCDLSAEKTNGLKAIRFLIKTDGRNTTLFNNTYTYSIGISNGFWFANSDTSQITSTINQQTQQQQQNHEETQNYLEDTNSTSTENSANNFFGNFTSTDSGGLSSIITAPLVMVNKMLDGQCVMPSATWKGATISLPCGDLLWSREGASDLRNLLNVFYGGFICYYAIRKLFLMIEGMKDPTSDRIEVSDL